MICITQEKFCATPVIYQSNRSSGHPWTSELRLEDLRALHMWVLDVVSLNAHPTVRTCTYGLGGLHPFNAQTKLGIVLLYSVGRMHRYLGIQGNLRKRARFCNDSTHLCRSR